MPVTSTDVIKHWHGGFWMDRANNHRASTMSPSCLRDPPDRLGADVHPHALPTLLRVLGTKPVGRINEGFLLCI